MQLVHDTVRERPESHILSALDGVRHAPPRHERVLGNIVSMTQAHRGRCQEHDYRVQGPPPLMACEGEDSADRSHKTCVRLRRPGLAIPLSRSREGPCRGGF